MFSFLFANKLRCVCEDGGIPFDNGTFLWETRGTYPLVNVYITMETSPFVHVKNHYFFGDFP